MFHVINSHVYVSSHYRGHNIVVLFKGNGVMQIYEADEFEIEEIGKCNSVWFDQHSYKDVNAGYRKALDKLVSGK